MKNKGFTLIELLAVILILGIIALIAIPTVSSVVEQSRKGAFENTVDAVIKAIDQYAISQELSGDTPLTGIYSLSSFKDKLDLKGDYENITGYVELYNSQIISYSFQNDKYVLKNKNDEKITILKNERGESFLLNTYPYKDDYKDLIVNVYITYGNVPNEIDNNHKWSLSSDGLINAYVIENSDNKSLYDLYIVSENNISTTKDFQLSSWFEGFAELKSIKIDNIDTSGVNTFYKAFYNNPKLEFINVEVLNTSNAYSFTSMFYGDSSLKEIDVSNFDTSNIKYISNMFYDCISLNKIDLSNWNIMHLTNASSVFRNCNSLEYIDVSAFDMKEVNQIGWFFYKCESLKEIKGLNNWDTSIVFDFSGVFKDCKSLESLDISKWNTIEGKDFSHMFDGVNLSTLDLSSFNTRNAEIVKSMFAFCGNLRTIYVGNDWVMSSITNDENMFYNCINLKGKVSYNKSNIISDMANTNGYLTLKG